MSNPSRLRDNPLLGLMAFTRSMAVAAATAAAAPVHVHGPGQAGAAAAAQAHDPDQAAVPADWELRWGDDESAWDIAGLPEALEKPGE